MLRALFFSFFVVSLSLPGCGGGNGNHEFKSATDELPVDCLTKPNPGACHGAQTGFYYDYRDNRCKPFAHGGCGAQVPFQTLQACRDFCGADG